MAAAFYDGMLLLALWTFVTGIVVIARGNNGVEPGAWWYRVLLFVLGFVFFGWFWTHGGQTLGMRAWGLRLCRVRDAGTIHWGHALLRYSLAWPAWCVFGLGLLWCLVDPEKLAVHDRLSGTRVLRYGKKRE